MNVGEYVEGGRPPAVADDPVVANLSRTIAIDVARSKTARSSRRRQRTHLMAGLTLSFVVVGGTAAAAVPALIHWVPWQPDLVVERSFPMTGSTEVNDCTTVMRVVPDSATLTADSDDRLRAAREFLQNNDWSGINAELSDISERDRAGMERQGISESVMLTMHVNDQISQAFGNGGYLGDGVRLESAARCGSEEPQ